MVVDLVGAHEAALSAVTTIGACLLPCASWMASFSGSAGKCTAVHGDDLHPGRQSRHAPPGMPGMTSARLSVLFAALC